MSRLRKNSILVLDANGPGLKPIESIGPIQGAEAPCSLRKANREFFISSEAPCSFRKAKREFFISSEAPCSFRKAKREFFRSLLSREDGHAVGAEGYTDLSGLTEEAHLFCRTEG